MNLGTKVLIVMLWAYSISTIGYGFYRANTRAPIQPPANSLHLVAIESKLADLQKQIDTLKQRADIENDVVGDVIKSQRKLALQSVKPKTVWTDCWTSIEHGSTYRNCVDAQGNTSKRNY